MIELTQNSTLLSISLSFLSLVNFSINPNPFSSISLQNKRGRQTSWDKAFAKNVFIPKIVVDVSLLEKHGVLEVFSIQGWRSLLIDDKLIYPLLVKQFYANLIFNSNTRTLKSFIKGRDIVLDDSSLARILNIPNKG